MDAKIFVFVAHKDGKADDSALELVTAARSLFPGCTPRRARRGFRCRRGVPGSGGVLR